MRLQVLGSGDAFGSGGRLNTCFMVSADTASFLIDCGASSLIAMRRFGVDPGRIDFVLITHLHGDHFAGLPFLFLDAQFISRRRRPLVLAGPPGLGERLTQTMEALFPGMSRTAWGFAHEVVELPAEQPRSFGAAAVIPYLVSHFSGAPPYAYRIALEGKVICYSGDTEWTDSLIPAARDADLFLCECYSYDRKIRHHMDFATLRDRLPTTGAKRVVLTHMGPEMLARTGEIGFESAEDGQVIAL